MPKSGSARDDPTPPRPSAAEALPAQANAAGESAEALGVAGRLHQAGDVSRFDEACAELRASGISLKRAPGEYIVSRAKSMGASTAFESLDDAIQHGRALAAQNDSLRDLPPLGPTGKKSRRAQMYRHNRRVAAKQKKRIMEA